MTESFLRQAIAISILGHMALFSMFSLSFGPKVPALNFSRVYFWGRILRGSDLMSVRNPGVGYKAAGFLGKSEILVVDKINRESLLISRDSSTSEAGFHLIPDNNWHEKPPVTLTSDQEKPMFLPRVDPTALTPIRKEPAIMFYPKLPYHFALYFKDRQTVHIELMFQAISENKRNSVLVKRKISSGNLEADLLSMRYISHYLFIQQRAFSPGKWQTVKIDLSTVND